MSKTRTQYVCQQCGRVSAREMGVDIRCERRVTRILMEGSKAVGLECERPDGAKERYYANGGIVIAQVKKLLDEPLPPHRVRCATARGLRGHDLAAQGDARLPRDLPPPAEGALHDLAHRLDLIERNRRPSGMPQSLYCVTSPSADDRR
mgnify:CR=1 FL=1